MNLLDWVEAAAIENLRLHHKTADILAKESATTLTVLLAALGAGVAYSMRILDKGHVDFVGIGVIVITAYLAALSLYLVCRCMMIAPIPAVHNEPKNLLAAPGLDLDKLRRFELENLQARIEESVKRNERVATTLNKIRIAAVLGPVAILIFTSVIYLGISEPVVVLEAGLVSDSAPVRDHDVLGSVVE